MSLLEIKGLEKSFKEIKAVKGIDFKVGKGEVLGFLGPNGAGKSTTISMVSTLIKPDSGEILYNGESIIKKPKVIQPKLGLVPQDIALYPTLSGYENLQFWGRAYGLRKKKLKESIEKISAIIGIGDRLKDKVEKYSGGMKRRLNIGAALLHNPELVIMDEPTVGIDPQSRNHILETVLELNKLGVTIIYTSHYMEEVEFLCSRVCIMDKGEVIASGSKEQLKGLVSDTERIDVTFEKIEDEIVAAVNSIEGVDNTEVDRDNNKIEVIAKGNGSIVRDIINVTVAKGYSITSLDVAKPNLETVFLHLTGRALRD